MNQDRDPLPDTDTNPDPSHLQSPGATEATDRDFGTAISPPSAPPASASALGSTANAKEVASAESASSIADTVGTGTVVALGCIGGTVFLIVLGLVYLLITQLFG